MAKTHKNKSYDEQQAAVYWRYFYKNFCYFCVVFFFGRQKNARKLIQKQIHNFTFNYYVFKIILYDGIILFMYLCLFSLQFKSHDNLNDCFERRLLLLTTSNKLNEISKRISKIFSYFIYVNNVCLCVVLCGAFFLSNVNMYCGLWLY